VACPSWLPMFMFRISPRTPRFTRFPYTTLFRSPSFFQVNPEQTKVLYDQALDFAQVTAEDVVIDAFCGIGSISLFLARQAKKVRSDEHTSVLQSRFDLVCRLLLDKNKWPAIDTN